MHDASFHSLYAYLLAPAWWFGGTSPGYAAAKYMNAVVMTASLFPAYALGRLFLGRVSATLCAIATAAIPSLALTGVLMPESLAVLPGPLLTLCLAARALPPATAPRHRSLAVGLSAAAVAPTTRSRPAPGAHPVRAGGRLRSSMLVDHLPRAGGTLRAWTAGDRARRRARARRRPGHRGRRLPRAPLLSVVRRARTSGTGRSPTGSGRSAHSRSVSGCYRCSSRSRGRSAARCGTRTNGLFSACSSAAVLGFGLYTAVKASYISTTFSIRVEERNLIYLSPIAFICRGPRWLAAARVRPVPVATRRGVRTAYLLWTTPYHAYEHLYSDAFGLSILQWLNQQWFWTSSDLRWLLLGILAGGVAFAGAPRRHSTRLRDALHGRRRDRAGVAVIGWNLTGEIAAVERIDLAREEPSWRSCRSPPDWIDRETGRARTMFIGKSLSELVRVLDARVLEPVDPRRLVGRRDRAAAGPAATTPNFLRTDGALDPQLPDDLRRHAARDRDDRQDRQGDRRRARTSTGCRTRSAWPASVTGITPRRVDAGRQQPSSGSRAAAARRRRSRSRSTRTAACAPATIPARHASPSASAHLGHRRATASRSPDCPSESGAQLSTRAPNARSGSRPRRPSGSDSTTRGTFKAGDGRELSAQVGYAFKPR